MNIYLKKIYPLLVVLLSVFLFSYSISEARQGCCSRHGGVCGCGCCDGTGLSVTCAPYYPECNSTPTPVPVAPVAPMTTDPAVDTTPATKTMPTTSSPSPSYDINLKSVADNNSQESDNGGSLGIGITIGALGVGALAWFINKKKNEKKDIDN